MQQNFYKKFHQNQNLDFLISANHQLCYGDVQNRLSCCVEKLMSCGIKKGNRVAIFSDNSIEHIILLLTLWHIGAVAVPLNTRWPNEQIVESIKNIKAKFFFYQKKYSAISTKLSIPGYAMEHRSNNSTKATITPIVESSAATILFTSGSASKPKAALHTFNNHYYSAIGSNENIPVKPGERWFLSLPLFHVGGLAILFRTVLAGGVIVFPDHKKSLAENLEKLEPTHTSFVFSQLIRLLETKKSFPFFKYVLMGGSAIPEKLLQQSIKAGLPVYKSYGSTEMSSQITTTHKLALNDNLNSSGKPLNFRQIKIDGNKIFVKGKTLFKGYVEGNKVVPSTEKDGWFNTGDLGYWDKDGNLIVTGRSDNMFISGGENIQPEEIENCLLQNPAIKQAIVVPVENAQYGSRPVVFIKFANKKLTINHIRNYLSSRIAKFKIPDYLFEIDSPTTQNSLKTDRGYYKKLANKLLAEQLTVKQSRNL